MNASTRTRFIPPPDDDIEVRYPYRRAWVSIIIECAILFGVTAALYVLVNFIGINLRGDLRQALNLLVALLPALLWIVFSLYRERAVEMPRQRLAAVAIVSALVANAVGIPFVESVFQPDRWLPLGSAIERIIGYTFTIGITQELLKYIVVRYLAWNSDFRDRYDSLAYCAASAIGYATIVTVRYALNGNPSPDVVAAFTFDTICIGLGGSFIVSFGLSEVRFGRPFPLLQALTLAAAAAVSGAGVPLRTGLVNASFSLLGAYPSPLFGIILSAVILIGAGVVIGFLYRNAEREAREALGSESRP